MTRVTIVKEDSIMLIDGMYQRIDCSDLPENFHALQWSGTQGEVEWKGNPRPQNTIITSLDDYQIYFDRWNAEKLRQEELQAEFQAAMLAEIANTANTSPI